MCNAPILATDAHAHPGAEAESGKKQRRIWKLRSQKVERCTDVTLLTPPAVMRAGAEASAAKIETQNRESKRTERFRRLVDDLVMQGAAEKRMRMADQRGKRWHGVCRRPQNCFKTPHGTFKKKISRLVSDGQEFILFYFIFSLRV